VTLDDIDQLIERVKSSSTQVDRDGLLEWLETQKRWLPIMKDRPLTGKQQRNHLSERDLGF
jgi:hypothetical protein